MVNFVDFLYPVMKYLSKTKIATTKECFDYSCTELKISDKEKSMLYEKSKENIVYNKFRFAILYLKKANLILSETQGKYAITKSGEDIVARNSNYFPKDVIELIVSSVKNNQKVSECEKPKKTESIVEESSTQLANIDPYDGLEVSISNINEALESEVLERLHNVNPYYFEKIVLDLLYKMGYAGDLNEIYAKFLTSKSNDEGIDGIINEDRLGLHQLYIQAKRYETNPVGRREIQSFVGAMMSKGAQHGIFVTTSDFNQNAIKCAQETSQLKIRLINGSTMARLMVEYGLGVSTVNVIPIKKIDNDYFENNN